MRRFMHGLGFVLFHVCRFAVKAPGAIFGVFLDAVYGPPVMAPGMRAIAPSTPSVRDFQATIPLLAKSTVASRPAAPAPAKESSGLVLRSAPAVHGKAPPEVSERVHLAEVVGPAGLVFGVMWIYLYPDRSIAKRVFKVTDRKLAKSLKKDRYFMDQVPYDPQKGSAEIMQQMHKEVVKLLDVRASVVRDKRAERPAASVTPPPTIAKAVAAPAAAAKETPKAAPAPAAPPAPAREVKRNVAGDVYEGIVTVAQMTTKNGGASGSYRTFCLTLNDGRREVPLYGTELERQVTDLRLEIGERAKVVFMGKSETEIPGKGKGFKNLYQVMRVPS